MSDPRWSQDDVRRFALSLPETHEASHHGRADLRVRNRIFATLPEDGRTVNLKATRVNLDLLRRMDPETFLDVWDGRWVGVVLERIEPEALRELVVEAWAVAAPKTLAARVRAGEVRADAGEVPAE